MDFRAGTAKRKMLKILLRIYREIGGLF
jgi:hypothetical protein